MALIKTKIVRIGDALGILIPDALMEKYQLQEEVELEPMGNDLVIKQVANPRAGWDKAFREMAEREDDTLLDGTIPLETAWDKDEWEW